MIPKNMKSVCFRINATRWLACKALGKFWPGVYTSGLSGLSLREIPVPALPDNDWVLCRTRLGGICGTDLGTIFLRQHPGSLLKHFTSWPISMGHENVATIVKTGDAVDSVQPGQRILVDPPLACAARKIDPPCFACKEGKPSTCWNFDRGTLPPALGIGYNNFTGGSWSPYFVAHKSQIHVLPDEIPDEQAILIDPIACSLHAVLQDPPAASEKILIFGAGIIGLGIVMAIRALELPVDITVAVRRRSQADLAMQCGANHTVSWTPEHMPAAIHEMAELTNSRGLDIFYKMRFLQGGFDRLYDCTGNIAALAEAQRLIRSGGKLILAGTPQLGLADLTCFWFRELKVQGVTGRAIEPLPNQQESKHDYRHVIDMIQRNRLDLSVFNVKLYPQQEYRSALTDLHGKSRSGIHKAAFDFRPPLAGFSR